MVFCCMFAPVNQSQFVINPVFRTTSAVAKIPGEYSRAGTAVPVPENTLVREDSFGINQIA